MADDGESIDWRKLREFADVELTKSYVLAWLLDGGALLVEVDLELSESHAFYEKPRPAERVCIRPATIEFPYLQSLSTPSSDGAGAGEIASGGF